MPHRGRAAGPPSDSHPLVRQPGSKFRVVVLVGLVLFVSLTTLAEPAYAQSARADVVQLFERGLDAYREGRYEEAAAIFAEAHEIQPVPDLTYNRARALENLGQLREAAAAYRLYLEEMPDAADRRGIEERARSLDQRAEDAEQLQAERARLLEEERRRLVDAVAPPRSSWSPDPAPWVVAGGGAAILIASAITGGVAQADIDRARSPDIAQVESDSLERGANDLALATNVLLAVGGVALAAGLVWGIVDVTSGSGPSAEVALVPGGIVVRGQL